MTEHNKAPSGVSGAPLNPEETTSANTEQTTPETGADMPPDPSGNAPEDRGDDSGHEAPPDPSPEKTGEQIAVLQTENADLKDRLLRAAAEMENMRRRAERERADAARFGAAKFARDMISVADNLRRALEAVPEEERAQARNIIEGIEMTEKALLDAFETHGITPLTPEPGDKFDPNLHEAMFEVPGSGKPRGSVAQVVDTGYMMGDRLLRAARVGVAKDEAGPGAQVDTTA